MTTGTRRNRYTTEKSIAVHGATNQRPTKQPRYTSHSIARRRFMIDL